jgi:predicted CopG family antitoxin
MSKSTILIESITRERLKEIGRKGQSYDELINRLLDIKKGDSPDRRFATL